MNKSLEERQNANDKMREVNQAFEVLGDEEKRKRYDLGETNFSTARDTESFDEYVKRKKEEMKDAKKKIKLIGEFLLRRDAINEIKFELVKNRVYYASYLDRNL